MKKLIIFIFALIIFSCNDILKELEKPLGKQYYRLTQYDFDGTSTIYYSDKIIENKNHRINNRVSNEPLAITCTTEGVAITIGYNFTYILIENGYHDGTIIIDGNSINPIYCDGSSCFWIVNNDNIIETKLETNGTIYTWEGTPFDCDSVPIELLEFNIKPRSDGRNIITIITASEINADYAVIERSPNMNEWTLVQEFFLENNLEGAKYIIID